MIVSLSKAELASMACGGAMLSRVFRTLRGKVHVGVTTGELDELAHKLILSYGGEPAFLGYIASANPFPASLCVSLNDEIVHGIPSLSRVLQKGDLVSLDFGVRYKGFYADAAITIAIEPVSDEKKKLLRVTEQALYRGIDAARVSNTTGDIGYAVQRYVEQNGFSVIRDLVGHGIGTELHAEPQVPNFGRPGEGVRLEDGMVIAIEPMVAVGGWRVRLMADGWTYKTADGSLSAHFEHTVAITKRGPKVLTK